jgi:hypothetical protein
MMLLPLREFMVKTAGLMTPEELPFYERAEI